MRRIRRLAGEIGEVVAGQLWIQICDHDPDDDTYVAKKILDLVVKESMAELGVGDLAALRVEDVDFVNGVVAPTTQWLDEPLKSEG